MKYWKRIHTQCLRTIPVPTNDPSVLLDCLLLARLLLSRSSVPYGDDECVEHVEESQAERDQTQLLPAQHPAVQPVWEAP